MLRYHYTSVCLSVYLSVCQSVCLSTLIRPLLCERVSSAPPPGVLLPGQRLSFPYTFKSLSAGIFSETWALQTGPVLAKGRPLVITLRGVAFQEDLQAHRREEIEVGEWEGHCVGRKGTGCVGGRGWLGKA